LQFIGILSGWR